MTGGTRNATNHTTETNEMNNDQQARHLRTIVTPARTGQEIGRNRRRHHPDRNFYVALASMLAVAAALGWITAEFLKANN